MYSSEPILFEVPVRPRTQKFIRTKLQDEAGRPQPMLVTPTAEGAGLMLWALAQSQKLMLQMGWRRPTKEVNPDTENYLHTDGAYRIIAPPDMTAKLGLGIHEFHPSRRQYLLNYAELEVFANFVDYIILNEMVCFCQAEPEISPLIRIKAFTDRYDFSEDDMSEGSLRVAYWRYRKGVSSHSFDAKIVQLNHFVAYALAA